MKKITILSLTSLVIIGVTSCINVFKLADLRTETAIQNSDEVLAKQLLADMGKAHGIENWLKLQTYTVLFEDEFFGPLGKYSSPYGTSSGRVTLHYIPGVFDGSMTFKNGKYQGETWGIYAWRTYELTNGKATEFKKNKAAEFWIPTYQYFIEFPLRIQSATALNYAGEMKVDGIQCKGLIASWQTIYPQKDLDQYVIWLDSKTNRIVKLEYTIRDINKFVSGATYFRNYEEKNGILLPSKMSVESNLVKEGYLHEMRILEFTANKVKRKHLQFNEELMDSK